MKKITLTLFCFIAFAWSLTAQMKIFPGGNMSIGTTSAPQSSFKMHVRGHSLFTYDTSAIVSAAYIRGNNNYSYPDSPDYTWIHDDKTGIYHSRLYSIGFASHNHEVMEITEAHNLLIGGTYDGRSRVTINSGVDSTSLITSTNHTADYNYAQISYVNRNYSKSWAVVKDTVENFYVYGNGKVFMQLGYFTSDLTLKENIQPLQNAKDKILGLNGVSYTFKADALDNPAKVQIGLIAQEVEQVVPEVVGTNDHGIKGIAYQNLVALLIEGFKEQNAELENMQLQLNECCNAGTGGNRNLNGSENNSSKNNLTGENKARLDQNQPNPFNTNTKINFFIPGNAISKTLMVFDMQGTLLKQISIAEKGESFITIHANEFRAGMYMYSLIIDGKEIDTKRMILTN